MQPITVKIKTMDVAPLWITKYEDIYGFIKVAIVKTNALLFHFTFYINGGTTKMCFFIFFATNIENDMPAPHDKRILKVSC